MTSATGIDKHVGNRMRVRRLSLGVSQQELAQKLGLTFQQIQKYEKGANRIGASRLYELANFLGVDVNFFFDGLEDGEAANHHENSLIAAYRAASPRFGTREFVDLNRAFQRIGQPELRELLISLFDAIAEQHAEAQAGGTDGAAPSSDDPSSDDNDDGGPDGDPPITIRSP